MLTDNEKTATVEHAARTALRDPRTLVFAGHHAITVSTCEAAGPASQVGSESMIKPAEADLVPHEITLRATYASSGELEPAPEAFGTEASTTRIHRVAQRTPWARAPSIPAAPRTTWSRSSPVTPLLERVGRTEPALSGPSPEAPPDA